MAEGKKSFVLYTDTKETWEMLSDEQAGKLIKHIIKYVNDENPVCDDPLINIAFSPIKQALKRDLHKWEQKQEQRREAGKRSAELRKKALNEIQQTSTIVESVEHPSTVNVSGSVNGSVSVSDNVKKKNTKDIVLSPVVDLTKIENEFYKTLIPFVEKYGKDTVRQFYEYWTEPNKSKTKLKFQMEKTWDVARRLSRWESNNYNKKNNLYDQLSKTKPDRTTKLKGWGVSNRGIEI